MRRELAVMGFPLSRFASAVTLGLIAICPASNANEILGEWATQGHGAHVRIEHCSSDAEMLCGVVTWLWESADAKGQLVRDVKNPDPKLRDRPVIGVALLQGFHYRSPSGFVEGEIYNPENGRTYSAALTLRSPDVLEVKGCILFLCDTQVWRRLQSLCASTDGAVALDQAPGQGANRSIR